jgi:hypothetical protein
MVVLDNFMSHIMEKYNINKISIESFHRIKKKTSVSNIKSTTFDIVNQQIQNI